MNLSIQSYNTNNMNLAPIYMVKNSIPLKNIDNVSFGNNNVDKFEYNGSGSETLKNNKRWRLRDRLALFFSNPSKRNPDNLLVQNQEQAITIRNLIKQLNQANGKIQDLNEKLSQKDNVIADLKDDVSEFKHQISVGVDITDAMEQEKLNAEKQLYDVILAHEKGEVNPKKKAEIEDEIKTGELTYNYLNPYVTKTSSKYSESSYKHNFDDIKTGTNNRGDMKELVIPEIGNDGSFHLEMPQGVMKIKKAELKHLDESFEIQSNISEKYSNSLVWNTDKVSRDLLQNFFDGHGQTLDGVKFSFDPLPRGSKNKYRVRIEGKSIYNYKEAVLLGESQSHENNKAAGNYGEGLKMVTLKLLKDSKVPEVKIGSGNWEVRCSMKKDDRLDSELMNYKISPKDNFDGNYIEFETSDKDLLRSLRNTINRFYHSSNKDFRNPDFENELFGIKALSPHERGGIYVAGQKFEYEGNYDGLKGGVIFIKEKIPTNTYDVSRDRTSIKRLDIYDISKWLAKSSTFEERMQIMKSLMLKDYDSHSPMDNFLDAFLEKLHYDIMYDNKGAIKFPDNFFAMPFLMDPFEAIKLKEKGYKLFANKYCDLGMKSVNQLIEKSLAHEPLEPTSQEKQKILILKKALNSLSNLTNYHLLPDELDAKIYIFDASSSKENKIRDYENVLAEAILEESSWGNKRHKGFWLDRKYLNEGEFPTILETALHELAHKKDCDGTKEFGYELTAVNRTAIHQMINDPKLVEEFRILNEIWNDLSKQK